jgi:hypothetical protein
MTRASESITVKVAVASGVIAGLGGLAALWLLPEVSPGTVVFFAAVAAIALFGAARAAMIALSVFRQVARRDPGSR